MHFFTTSTVIISHNSDNDKRFLPPALLPGSVELSGIPDVADAGPVHCAQPCITATRSHSCPAPKDWSETVAVKKLLLRGVNVTTHLAFFRPARTSSSGSLCESVTLKDSDTLEQSVRHVKSQAINTLALHHHSASAQQHCSTTALQHNSTAAPHHRSTTSPQHHLTATPQHCNTLTLQRHSNEAGKGGKEGNF